jgi:DNA-binding response OmpR family regulator
MGPTPNVLIVEDDRKIATLVAKNLEAAGFSCHAVHDGEAALNGLRRLNPSLIVLDIMLPGIDGLELTRRIRRDSEVPILMLTARTSEGDKVLGFEIGADDYLTKPFSTRELVARVRALLRRSSVGGRQELLVRGELRIDPGRREVVRGDTTVELTTLEFDLLHFLASRPGRVFTREALMDQVWGEERIVDDRSIDSLVSRLRRKLERDPAKPIHIQTVWGAGYRFAENPS